MHIGFLLHTLTLGQASVTNASIISAVPSCALSSPSNVESTKVSLLGDVPPGRTETAKVCD